MKVSKNSTIFDNKTKRFRVVLLLLLLAVTITFIWSNSLEGPNASQAKSLKVLEKITPFLEFFVGKGNVTDFLVRKLGHFTEFFALGFELALFISILNRVKLQPVINCMSLSLAVAVTDESLQILSNRGSMVSDVLLDFCGSVSGILFILLLYFIFKSRKN